MAALIIKITLVIDLVDADVRNVDTGMR